MKKNFHCCMDCGPDVIARCRSAGCQVKWLLAAEKKAVKAAKKQKGKK